MGSGGVEFVAEGGGNRIVNRVGLTVPLDAQLAFCRVGAEVDGGFHEAAHEAAGVVTADEGLAHDVDEGGLGAVGEEFDGVDEVLPAAAKLGDALLGREVAELDVSGGGFALVFVGLELALGGGEEGEGGSFLLFVAGGGGGVVVLGAQGVGGEGGTLAGELSGTAADLAVEGAPGGIDEAGGVGKRAGAMLDELIQSVVLTHVFEEVFLIPTGEHGGGGGGGRRC